MMSLRRLLIECCKAEKSQSLSRIGSFHLLHNETFIFFQTQTEDASSKMEKGGMST